MQVLDEALARQCMPFQLHGHAGRGRRFDVLQGTG